MFINAKDAREFVEKGNLIGKSTPCRATKGMWWEVYSWNNRTVAVCMDLAGVCCGEEITLDKLSLYTD